MTTFLDDLPQRIKQFAEFRNLMDPRIVVVTPIAKLVDGKCTEDDIKILKAAAAKIVARKVQPALDLLGSPKWSRLSFGCKELDRVMRGGLITRGITEICGQSGVGKTQLLLQLSLTVQLPVELGGLNKATVYICTEDLFPSKRLYQIAESFSERYSQTQINYLSNIYIEHVFEGADLLQCVSERLTKLMTSVNIGLIVIDSVAAIYRVYSDYIARAQEMRRLVNRLLQLADKYNCVVACVNQMTTVSANNSTVPCLGLAWAHLGRTRIKISKMSKQYKINRTFLNVRKFEVLYSPETPNETAEFLVTEKGVVDLNAQEEVKF